MLFLFIVSPLPQCCCPPWPPPPGRRAVWWSSCPPATGTVSLRGSARVSQRLSCDDLYILYAVYHLYVCNNVIINNKKCEENINISTNNVFVHLMDLMVGNTTAFCKSNSGYRSIKFQYCCGQILTNITWQATLARWRCTPTSPRSGAARTRATSSTSTGGSPGCYIIKT